MFGQFGTNALAYLFGHVRFGFHSSGGLFHAILDVLRIAQNEPLPFVGGNILPNLHLQLRPRSFHGIAQHDNDFGAGQKLVNSLQSVPFQNIRRREIGIDVIGALGSVDSMKIIKVVCRTLFDSVLGIKEVQLLFDRLRLDFNFLGIARGSRPKLGMFEHVSKQSGGSGLLRTDNQQSWQTYPILTSSNMTADLIIFGVWTRHRFTKTRICGC
mmetsp:Transcript_21553/g.37090  ORF Transcript_21553/g.37090 Transcript_21553/m.37090 type:complete len:213 (+) Transcript_21553:1479-2117(+)